MSGISTAGRLGTPEELRQLERKFGRARVVENGPRGITAYAVGSGKTRRYLGFFDMSSEMPGYSESGSES